MVSEQSQGIDRWETCGHAWVALLRHVWAASEAGLDECGATIEAPPCLFEVAEASWDDPILREHGDTARLNRRSQARVARPVKSEYTARLRALRGVDQVDWTVGLLRHRPWSTGAWVPLTVPGEDPRKVPPLTAVAFRIRAYRLHMTAMFRSQDVHTGYLTHIPLRAVQLEVAEELSLPAGPMRVFIDVPYVYLADADKIAGILAAVPERSAA